MSKPARECECKPADERRNAADVRKALQNESLQQLSPIEGFEWEEIEIVERNCNNGQLARQGVDGLRFEQENPTANKSRRRSEKEYDRALIRLRIALVAQSDGAQCREEENLKVAVSENPHPQDMSEFVHKDDCCKQQRAIQRHRERKTEHARECKDGNQQQSQLDRPRHRSRFGDAHIETLEHLDLEFRRRNRCSRRLG